MAEPRYVSVDDLDTVMTGRQVERLSDDEGVPNATSTLNEDRVRRMLVMAEGIAESRLDASYELPLEPVPPLFQYAVLIVARFLLFDRRDGGPPERVVEAKDDALEWLASQPNFPHLEQDLEGFVGSDDDVFSGAGVAIDQVGTVPESSV